jgi:site-specific recombinase XerD
MNNGLGFQELLESYFLSWLIGRGVSKRTIEAYRDTFRIFLRWICDEKRIKADAVTMDDFTMDNIEAFLIHLSNARANAPKTVNCRLAVIRSFCRYVSYKDPLSLNQMKKILSIPQRKEQRADLSFLKAKEVGWLIESCDKMTAKGRETRLLIRLLYNSGARISEAVALKASDIAFDGGDSCRVKIIGKGRKERTLPLWPETAKAIKAHIKENGIAEDGYLFAGRNVEHLTRSGARSRIDEMANRASAKHPTLAKKKITPHTFRHSSAMAMLASGIDISTIAIWLGHENIQTTHRYMVADMNLKEDAVSKVHPDWDCSPGVRYSADPKTLAFLMSL